MKKLLRPGELAMCRPEADGLIIWSSYNCDYEDDIGKIYSHDILMILESRTPSDKEIKEQHLAPEWERGAYRVLTPDGQNGWTGEGWLIPVTI